MKRADVIAGLTEIRDPDFLFSREYLATAGIDLETQPADSRQLLETRATGGEVEAQFVLAKLLLSGLVGPIDRITALEWCQEAVQKEYPPALALLAGFYSEGWAG